MTDNARSELPVRAALIQMINGGRVAQAVYVAAKLGVADLLREGPKTAGDLAEACGAHAPSLYRLLRALASLGVFVERSDHAFDLTPLADLLRSDRPDSLGPAALLALDPYWWRSTGAMLSCVQTGRPAPMQLYGVDEWDYLAQYPDTAAILQSAMTANTQHDIPAILDAYDFSGIQTLVDIGGGQGALLTGILRAYPLMRGILADRAEVVGQLPDALKKSGVADRCEVSVCDLFGALPTGGDCYLLKLIIHDWDDQQATHILANLRRSMPGSARVLLIEHVILPGNDSQPGKLLDLAMLAYTGGRERTAAEWDALFTGARFSLTRIVPTQAALSILEGVPDSA